MSISEKSPTHDSSAHARDGEKDRMDRMEKTITGMGNTFRDSIVELDNTVKNFIEQQSHGEIPPTEGQGVEEPEERSERLPLLRQFQNFNPPIFRGSTNPTIAESWIREIEKLFNAMDCNDRQRVHFAVFKLAREDDHWWNGVKEGLRRSGPIT